MKYLLPFMRESPRFGELFEEGADFEEHFFDFFHHEGVAALAALCEEDVPLSERDRRRLALLLVYVMAATVKRKIDIDSEVLRILHEP